MFPRVAENNSPGKKLASRVEADRKGLFVQTPPHTSAGSSRASSNGPRVKYKLNMTPLEKHIRLLVLMEISELYRQTGPLDAALYAVRQQRTECSAHFFTWRPRRITRTSAACCHPVDRNGQHSSLTLKLFCTEETHFSVAMKRIMCWICCHLWARYFQFLLCLIISVKKQSIHTRWLGFSFYFAHGHHFCNHKLGIQAGILNIKKNICHSNYCLKYYFHPCQDFDEFVSEIKSCEKRSVIVLSECNIKCCWYFFYIFYSLLFLTFFSSLLSFSLLQIMS